MVTTDHRIYYVLRVAAAMCLIGHGMFGIITKPIWCNYFALFGIGHALAYKLMPVLGCTDILMGLLILFYPIRAIVIWLVIWGFITAVLRPLAGEALPELIERAGNFGAPLALLLLCGKNQYTGRWFKKLHAPVNVTPARLETVKLCLRATVFLLLAGHGWLNLIEKNSLILQYASLGFHHPRQAALVAGVFELVIALMVLLRPVRWLLLICLAWKISTELFYPNYEIVEWIERGGSYGAILALWFSLKSMAMPDDAIGTSQDILGRTVTTSASANRMQQTYPAFTVLRGPETSSG